MARASGGMVTEAKVKQFDVSKHLTRSFTDLVARMPAMSPEDPPHWDSVVR